MHFCYIDESGTSSIPGTTSHFVLAGLVIPVEKWKSCQNEINSIKSKYDLGTAEIHTGWILRRYLEQRRIIDFDRMDKNTRIQEVNRYRNVDLLRLQRLPNNKSYHRMKKIYKKTNDYIHLNYDERCDFIKEIGEMISKWPFARLFSECIDKIYFDPQKRDKDIDEQAFEQIVSRFQQYLKNIESSYQNTQYGLLIHDNNDTIAKRITSLMKNFYQTGTLFTSIENIIETPLFVNSELTSMVQLADLCAYSLRRYLENNENELFDMIFKRADRKDGRVVGVRHFSEKSCSCKICTSRIQEA